MSVSSVNDRLLTRLSIVLRQPAFFLIEAWLLSSSEKAIHKYFVDSLVLVVATAVILLPQDHLFSVYKYLAGAALMFMMHFYTHDLIDKSTNNEEVDSTEIILVFIILGLAGLLVIYLFQEKAWKKYILMAYHVPIITASLQIHHTNTIYLFNLAEGLVCSYFIYLVGNMLITGVDKMKKQVSRWIYLVNIFGFFPVIKSIVGSIYFTRQLLLFCFVSFAYKLHYFTTQTSDVTLVALSKLDWTTFLFVIAGQCCKTYLGLVSMCVAISFMSHCLFRLVNLYLYGWKSPVTDPDFSHEVIGVVAFVLSVSAGITISSKTFKDFVVKGFVIKIISMYTASNVINCTYELVDPGILTFSALPTSKPFKHIRGLTVYISFMISTIFIMYTIQQYDIMFIFIPVIITGVSTCLQVMASIVIYFLFVYDGLCSHPMEYLDDIIYYIRATVQVLDFVGSVILAGRGIWVIKTGAFSWIEIPFFILFCYTNVWERLQNGWKIFLLRKDAVQKLNALKAATKDQIRDCDDVCAICIRQMSSAKITPCGHLFHETCLKKWIYVRDSCPLCLRKLYNISPDRSL
ncbi:RING finger protein 145-like [Ostrea edulis]|uniref:RING finger protein 145-like n=1 Tax=Ostrea edulis TaxID=37623 RepID=UPI0024AFCCA6|nr:RING finger protein 145-like [Ostrea edulis]